jgi:hypothetical protein
MKTFDWEEAKKVHSAGMVALLKKTYRSQITEDDFVKLYQAVPMQDGDSKRGRRSPSVARNNYRNLKEKFGFFQ